MKTICEYRHDLNKEEREEWKLGKKNTKEY